MSLRVSMLPSRYRVQMPRESRKITSRGVGGDAMGYFSQLMFTKNRSRHIGLYFYLDSWLVLGVMRHQNSTFTGSLPSTHIFFCKFIPLKKYFRSVWRSGRGDCYVCTPIDLLVLKGYFNQHWKSNDCAPVPFQNMLSLQRVSTMWKHVHVPRYFTMANATSRVWCVGSPARHWLIEWWSGASGCITMHVFLQVHGTLYLASQSWLIASGAVVNHCGHSEICIGLPAKTKPVDLCNSYLLATI